MFVHHQIARVAADPAIVPQAAQPSGWPGLIYIRLHGSPKVYHSKYSPEQVETWATRLQAAPAEAENRWCIFDNTAGGEAAAQAPDLLRRLQQTSD